MEMLRKEQELRRNVVEILTIEDRIPRDHLLRKIDGAIDFGHIYDFVDLKSLYSEQQGRPSVDPVVLFKIVLLQHLYGNTVAAANNGGDRYEYGVPVVSGI